MPVYTVGTRELYDSGIEMLGREFKKVGRTQNYAGGFACRTVEDARRLIQEFGESRWAVYELEADWERDTTPSDNGWWHTLLVDAVVLRRVDDD